MGTLEGFVGNQLSSAILDSMRELVQKQEELQRILIEKEDTLNKLTNNLVNPKYEYVVLDILENDMNKKFIKAFDRTWEYADLSDAFEFLGAQGYVFVTTLNNTHAEQLVFQKMTLSAQLSTDNKFAVIEQERLERERARAEEREQAEIKGRTTMDNLLRDAGFHLTKENIDQIIYQYPNSPIEICAKKKSDGIEFQYNGTAFQYDLASEKLVIKHSGEEISSLKAWIYA